MCSAGTGKQLGVSRIGTSCPDGIPSHTLKRVDLYRALHDEATSRGIGIEHGRRAGECRNRPRRVISDASLGTGSGEDAASVVPLQLFLPDRLCWFAERAVRLGCLRRAAAENGSLIIRRFRGLSRAAAEG